MTTFTGTSGNDVANATSGTLTGFTGGTIAQLQDGTGDVINGLGGADTVVAGAGADTITGGTGADSLIGGLGADTFVIVAGGLAAGETINGTAETATDDTLRFDLAGTYHIQSFTTISNVDVISFGVDAAGFNITFGNNQVSSADSD